MAATSPSRIMVLSQEIVFQTAKIDKHFTSNNLQPPSIDEESPLMYPDLPPDVIAAQDALAEALDELWWINQGPIQTLHAKADCHDRPPFPRASARSYQAYRCDQSTSFLAPTSGMGLYGITADAFAKWPESEESNHAGFQLANNTDKEMYNYFSSLESPARAQRFKGAMTFMESMPGMKISHVAKLFDWGSLPSGAKVVDVGGSHGNVAIELTRSFPALHFVVQDLPRVIEAARVPEDVEGRVKFQAHDFFEPQTEKADVYYFRLISHGWSDKYMLAILKALIPALKPGVKVLFNDKCLAPPGTLPVVKDRWQRNFDLVMMATGNAAERDEESFKALFKKANQRFVFEGIRRLDESNLDMVVVTWTG